MGHSEKVIQANKKHLLFVTKLQTFTLHKATLSHVKRICIHWQIFQQRNIVFHKLICDTRWLIDVTYTKNTGPTCHK